MTKLLFGLLVVLLVSAVPVAVLAQDDMLPEVVEVAQPGIMPEGIEYDEAGGRFLVGSLTQGTIFQFGDDGAATPFVEDADLVSSVGIHIDEVNNRLLVNNSDSNVFFSPDEANPFAALAAYDLETGERAFYVDLTDLYESPAHFANDVTSDADGNAYVTNSFAPVIYQVTPDGEASIFVENELFANENIGLNGIDYHPDGYLLAAVGGAGAIFKIPLDDPNNVTQVEIDGSYGIDGMALDANNDLVAVASVEDGQAVVMLGSDDGWASAHELGRVETDGNATTLAIRDGAAYYTKAYFANPGQEVYDITQVALSDLMMMMDDMESDDMDDMSDDMEEPMATEEAG